MIDSFITGKEEEESNDDEQDFNNSVSLIKLKGTGEEDVSLIHESI